MRKLRNFMQIKNLLLCFVLIWLFIIGGNTVVKGAEPQAVIKDNSASSRFINLKNTLFATPYDELPSYKVSRKLFGPSKDNEKNKLLQAARRTFDDTSDLISFPSGQKLLNANGICFVGEWRITQENPFTGLYKKGVISPAIIRGSVALSGTRQKNKRSFGMAIKLLPHDLGQAPSLNAFVLHSMGGIRTKNLLDLSMDNQPPLGRLPNFRDISTALRLRSDLEKADKEKGAKRPSVSYRPVNDFAKYNQDKDNVIAPKWLKLKPQTETRIDEDDFRNEFNVASYPNNNIRYAIEVAADTDNGKKANAQWQEIGELILNKSVTSKACDTQLHFTHPKLTNNNSDDTTAGS